MAQLSIPKLPDAGGKLPKSLSGVIGLLVVAVLVLGIFVMSPFAGQAANAWDPRVLISIGMTLAGVGRLRLHRSARRAATGRLVPCYSRLA